MLDAHSSSWGWFAAGLVLVTLLSALVGAGVWYFGFRLPE